MPADVARNLSATRRMTNVDRIFQVERRNELGQVVRVVIHLVAIPRLTRPAMAAPVMRNAPEAALAQKQHLVFPRVRAQRPAMAENYRLPLAPILVINLCAVSRCYRAHAIFSFPL